MIEVAEVIAYGLLLPLLAAGVVMVAASRMGKGGRAVGAAVAVVAGFLVGNHFQQAVEYRIEWERPHAWDWLPWAALLAAGVGPMARPLPVVGRLVRALVAVLVAHLLVPDLPWLGAALAAAILAEWELLDRFGEEAGGWLPLGLGVVFLAAGAVLIHAHSARLTDLSVIVAGSYFGVALAARWTGADVRSAVPIAAVSLPGLLLVGQQSTYSEVPVASFALAALAPLVLALPLFVPRRLRRPRTFLGLGLLLAAVGAAVFLAAWAEPLSFD
jgi:hypothetical protein